MLTLPPSDGRSTLLYLFADLAADHPLHIPPPLLGNACSFGSGRSPSVMSLDPSWTPATPPSSMYLYWNELTLSPQNQFIIADLDAGHLVIKTSELKTLEWELTVDVRLSLCSPRVGWGRRTLTRALSLLS